MKSRTVLFLLFFTALLKAQQINVTSGTLRQFPAFRSVYVTARDVTVWLPDGYSGNEKYAVLYMHDGQALFDPETTWNKLAWDVDATAGKLNNGGKTKKFIVVGIASIAKTRHSDYFPQKAFESLPKKTQDSLYALGQQQGQPLFGCKINSDQYLKFIVRELKPFVDKTFSTYKDRKHTFIAGSSMGGLISLYAICEYPDIFGGAACLSTHWPGIFTTENNPIPAAFLNYMKLHLPPAKKHRIYFDYGNQTLDALYEPFQLKADEIMRKRGYSAKNWLTEAFPGADHSEKSWKERLEIPLVFLLGI